MGIACPKCGSEHVQAVKVILQSGTSFSSGTVTGLGVGTDVGVMVGTTASMSQTTLAARFAPPKKPKKLEMIGGGLLALVTSPWLGASGPDVGWRYMSLALWAVFAYFVWDYRRKAAAYKEQYPTWKAMHDDGFYCHRCGTSFLRGK